MKGPEQPLPLEALAELRHELRTPLNHIIGYSELLQEEPPEGAPAKFLDELGQLHAAGKQLLGQINEGLAASRKDVTAADLRGLGQRLQPPVQRLLALAEGLLRQAQAPEMAGCRGDLQRISTAAGQLQAMIGERLLALAPAAVEKKEPERRELPHAGEERQRPDAAAETPGPGQRVLVVDDIETNRDMLRRRLERHGYAVAVAENGRRALEVLHAGKFDLVLLDIMMPEVDGYQVLGAMKSAPDLRDIPVIMISALDEIQSVVRCIEMGAEDYLPKPFDPVLLRARVGACLEKKRLRDQELEYLRDVAVVTEAAAAVQQERFDPESLAGVARRDDALGQLVRVFQHMAREVYAREQRLKQQVQELRVQIDESRKARQVEEITGSDYFQALQQKAQQLRRRAGRDTTDP
jgi:DNA-binding response OmpR family regulator